MVTADSDSPIRIVPVRTATVRSWRCGCLVFLLSSALCAPVLHGEEPPLQLIHVTLTDDADWQEDSLSGRIVLTAADGGILLEEPNGTLHNLSPDEFRDIQDAGQPFTRLDSDSLATDLVNQMGAAFAIRQTEHFVICSAGSDTFTEHLAELLEEVYDEFFGFFESDSHSPVRRPEHPLPVVIFRSTVQLQQHARRQHPKISFDAVPGYYSSRFNRMYISDILRESRSRGGLIRQLKKVPRHTETIVHEVVHQLGYNSGLHIRFADNPLWFTEGVALYFESYSGRGRLLWSGPGRPNAVHLRHLRASGNEPRLPVSLTALISDNAVFQAPETTADAYAVSWALLYHLIHGDREAFNRLSRRLQQRKPLREIPAADELTELEAALRRRLPEVESDVMATLRTLRIRRR